MSKKSNRFKGYLLIEALFSLGILGMITGIYMTVNLSLLNKNRQLLDQLSLYRVLFEELQLYDLTAGNITKDRMINDKEVKINFSKNEKELIKVEILNEKDHFFISTKKQTDE